MPLMKRGIDRTAARQLRLELPHRDDPNDGGDPHRKHESKTKSERCHDNSTCSFYCSYITRGGTSVPTGRLPVHTNTCPEPPASPREPLDP